MTSRGECALPAKVYGEKGRPKTGVPHNETFAYAEGGGRIISDAEGRLWHTQGKMYWQVFPAVKNGDICYVYYG